MKTIYLLSGPEEQSGFTGEIVKYIKSDLKNKNSICFIASSSDSFDFNDKFSNICLKWFEAINIDIQVSKMIDRQ